MKSKSQFVHQLSLLLWKNFQLKRRSPISLIIEMIIPLSIIFILVYIRKADLKVKMNSCSLKEKNLASMGLVVFIKDFMCSFNTSCYNNTQIHWNDSSPNKFQAFLNNVSDIYHELPSGKYTVEKIGLWFLNSKKNSKLEDSLNYFEDIITPIIKNLAKLKSGDLNEMQKGMKALESKLCGSKKHDMEIFNKIILFNAQFKNLTTNCETTFSNYFRRMGGGWDIYSILSPLIFGNIYYTPVSAFTRKLIKRANVTLKIMDYLRLSSVEWRLNFKSWFVSTMEINDNVKVIRSFAKDCAAKNDSNFQFCSKLGNALDMKNINLTAEMISFLFSFIESGLNCTNLNKFFPLLPKQNIDDMNTSSHSLLAVIVFNETFQYLTPKNATFLNYQIRMPMYKTYSTQNFKVLDQFWTPFPRVKTQDDLKYYTSGFVILQEAIDHAFIELITGNDSMPVGSSMQIMPYPCYVNDIFFKFMSTMFPFLLIIAWAPSLTYLIKGIVYEKENQLKEYMRVMGLNNLVHWVGWFISIITILIFPVSVMTIIFKLNKILEFSSSGVIFFLLFSYAISLICQAFMISTFFDKANVASVAGGIIYFAFYMPFLVFVNLQDVLSVKYYYIIGLLSQVSFSNSLQFIVFFEQTITGAQFSNLFESGITNLDFGIGNCIMMLYFDSLLYLLIAWYVESVFPGKFGVSKPWYFPFLKQYWLPNLYKTSQFKHLNSQEQCKDTLNQSSFENEPKDLRIGISIKDLVKIFPNAKSPSVNNLNLNFYQSQITAFLGHNGAGKTTTISILTGMYAPTSGTAFILDEDIRYDIENIRQKIGLCPQHNILFDSLTVEDHIYFYGFLKRLNKSNIKEILPKIIEDVGLSKKRNSCSKNLSGGMKRKLSVAMTFLGDPQIVFLDEPTAGVDPFARRGIWDLLMKYRNKDRTIVLTTHHMDEADYLSDRIAIISQGKLQCCGSPAFLKKRYGIGYYLILVKHPSMIENSTLNNGEKILAFVKMYIEDAKLVDDTTTQWSIVLPHNEINSHKFSILFENLDKSLNSLNILSYGLSDTSLEEVFLTVANDPSGKVEDEKNDEKRKQQHGDLKVKEVSSNDSYVLLTGVSLLSQQLLGLQIKRFHYTRRNIKGFIAELILPILVILLMISLLKISDHSNDRPPMVISPWLMMPNNRYTTLNTFYRKEGNRNKLEDKLVEVLRSDLGESGVRCMNPSVYRLPNLICYTKTNHWTTSPTGKIPLLTPDCDCSTTGYQDCRNKRSGGPQNSYRIMESSDVLANLTGYNISDYLMKKFKVFIKKQYGGYQILLPSNYGQSSKQIGLLPLWNGVRGYVNSSENQITNLKPLNFLDFFQTFFNLSGIKTNFTRIWINSKGYVSLPAYANIFSNILLRSTLNSSQDSSKYGISVTNYPLKLSHLSIVSPGSKELFLQVSLAVFVIFGLSFIPASFVIFLIEERVSGAKRQQFVSGINPFVYWYSNFIWDIIKYSISVFFIILIFVAFDYQAYIGSKNASAFIILLFSYGFGILPHMYPFSYCISTPSTAFVVLDAYNLLVGSITTLITFIMDLLEDEIPNFKITNDVLKQVFLIFPQYDLGRGMMDLSFNYIRFNSSSGLLEYDPFAWDITGQKYFSLSLLFLFWCSVIIVIESGIIQRSIFGKFKNRYLKHQQVVYEEDVDVATERARLTSPTKPSDVLQVINLTKIYNPSLNFQKKLCKLIFNKFSSVETRKLAVNNLCFGVKEGECFGLLGLNGAGKTTTFKMLTGEESITIGNALINGYSIITDMINAHKNMGFCPQFDALYSLLNCEEHLYFYCRIRGIDSSDIKSCVERSLKNFSLTPHAQKTSQNLSGGNKRKLSTAIALIGWPKVIFLDEPTSGMDAGARRFLWNIIQKITNELKNAVILTSHNMEECDVLCHRLSIMMNGVMKCIGSVQHLKSKFGDEYYITIRTYSDQNRDNKRQEIKDIMKTRFQDGVTLYEENYMIIKYQFSSSSTKLSGIFEFFEDMKKREIILDFSVSQTSLDDVFISFAEANVLTTV